VRKPFERIVVGEADRLSTEIAGRHHQHGWPCGIAWQPEQQRVQRRVGEHDAEVGVARRHRVGDPRVASAGHQDDRSLRTGE
jgi:hypothetical protein